MRRESRLRANPHYNVAYRPLASALAHAGRLDEARAVVARLPAQTPDLTLRSLAELTPFKHSGRLEMILDGLRKASLLNDLPAPRQR